MNYKRYLLRLIDTIFIPFGLGGVLATICIIAVSDIKMFNIIWGAFCFALICVGLILRKNNKPKQENETFKP